VGRKLDMRGVENFRGLHTGQSASTSKQDPYFKKRKRKREKERGTEKLQYLSKYVSNTIGQE
jgi:hypothetical protein